MQGYEINRFDPQPLEIFTCPTCTKIVRDPLECQGCGQMYCQSCSPINFKKACLNNCTQGSFSKITGALLKMYNGLELICSNPECKKKLQVVEMENHEKNCYKVKCLNFENCQEMASTQDPYKFLKVCGNICQITIELLECKDPKHQYQIVSNFVKNLKGDNQEIKGIIQNPKNQMEIENQIVNFKWDVLKCGQGISLTNEGQSVFLKEGAYMFRTVLSNVPLMNGVHYWEIEADSRTENELKIGVCQGNNLNLNAAFCDQAVGFAYYGLAQLRNGSNASGSIYGKRFKKEGVLGVCLNMVNGTLSFALNGDYMGIAFRSDILKQGPIFAAVALLHCAGCTLKTGKQKPAYME